MLEYDIPGHLGRCDAVLIGRSRNQELNAIVIEMKRWIGFVPLPQGENRYVEFRGGFQLSPAYQVLQYRDKLRYFHEKGAFYNWHGAVLMTQADRPELEALKESFPGDCHVWSLKPPLDDCHELLSECFGEGIGSREYEDFVRGRYKQDARFAAELLKKLPQLTRGVAESIGCRPLDPTPSQQDIVSFIGGVMRNENGALIVISGAPGSGKTIVGLLSLADALCLTTDKPSILALRNNRLCHVVRAAIDSATTLNIASAIVQYVKGNGPNVGIYPKVKGMLSESPDSLPIYALIVLDEAHRIPHVNPNNPSEEFTQLKSVLLAGNTVVCLVDEGQVLNEDDAGTQENIISLWRTMYPDKPIYRRELNEQHRVPAEHMKWIDNLLEGSLT